MPEGYQGIMYEPILAYVVLTQPSNIQAQPRNLQTPQTFDTMLEFLCSIPEGAVIINPAREALTLRERARAMASNKTEFDLKMAAHHREIASRGLFF